MFRVVLRVCALLLLVSVARGQVAYTGGTYTQNFDGLPNTGTFTLTGTGPIALSAAPINATGLNGWSLAKVSGTGSVATFLQGTGSATTGAVYSFGSSAATDRALGALLSGTVGSVFGVVLTNNTGATITKFTLSYTGEQWRYGAGTLGGTDKLSFEYQVGGTDIITGTFTAATALDFTSRVNSATAVGTAGALDGNASANRVAISATITGISWAAGQNLVLRWKDFDVAGSDDGLAIDDLNFNVPPPSIGTQPSNQTATSGQSASFSVSATGTGTLVYQWRKNGTNISGNASATTATLNLSSVTTADSGSSYDVVVTDAVGSTTSSAATLTVNKITTAVTLDAPSLTATYNGAQHAATATTNPSSGVTLAFTYNGSSTAPTNAGSYAVVASCADSEHTGSASGTLTISPAAETITLSNLAATYDGAPHAASVTTSPVASIATSVTYNGSATAPTNAGSYAVAATITDSNYSGSASGTLVISPASQTITFNALANHFSSDPPFTISATASSGLAVAFAITSGSPSIATISGSTITLAGGSSTGTVTVQASQSGNTNYTAAPNVSQSFTVALPPASITTQPASQTVTAFQNATFTVAATTSVGTLSYQWRKNGSAIAGNASALTASLTLTNVTATDAATYDVLVTAPGGTVQSNPATLTINKAAATVTLGALAATYDATPHAATATTNPPGLTTAITYNGSATAPTSGGSYAVVATINDANYAGTASGTLVIAKIAQTVTFPPANTFAPVAGTPFTASATASSGLTPITFTIVSGNATATGPNGATITPLDRLAFTVRATQAGDANYNAATADLILAGDIGLQTITFQPPAYVFSNGPPIALTATASSGLPVTFALVSGPATLSGNTLFLTGATGTLLVAASQSGNSTYQPASITQAINVLSPAAVPAITFPSGNVNAFVGDVVTLTPTINASPPPTSYQWSKGGTVITGATSATLTLASAALTDSGSYTLTATNTLGTGSSPAVVLTVTKIPQTISFTAPTTSTPAGGSTKLSATASSGLPVTFALVSGSGSINAGVLIGNSPTVVVRASQPGNAIYDVAPTVDQTFKFFTGGSSPTLLTVPSDQIVDAGATVTFSASANGTPAPTWQWQKDGVTIAGATSATLTLPAVTIFDAARYTVVASNPLADASASAALSVRSAPVITTPPVAKTANVGASVTFSVTAVAFPAPTYQWRKNGAPISGATSATLTLTNLRATDAANYDVVVTNSFGPVTSPAARLTVTVHDFSGEYFGRFAGATGDFALHVRADGTAVFIGYLPGLGTAIVTFDVVVDGSGNFSLSTVTAASTPADLDPRIAAAPRTVTLRGTLNDTTGALTGSVSELGATLSGTRAAATGAASAQAGFYQGAFAGTASGRGYVVVGADGQAFFLATNGTSLDGVKTTLASNGHLAATTAAQSTLDLGFNSGALTGTVATPAGTATLTGAADGLAGTEHLINLSVRAPTGPGPATLITGFVVTGTAPKQVLIRAAGPAIAAAPFNVAGALADPALQVFRGSSLVAQNDNWSAVASSANAIASAATAVGAFAFRNGSADAALLTTLAPGAYTVQVAAGANATGASGIVLAEVYEVLETTETPGARRLANLSARGAVAPGAPLIAGFVITGTAPQRVLVRGIGPALAAFGVTGALANPALTLARGGTTVKTNDDWFRDPDAALTAAAAKVGAFPLGANSLDAAALIYLTPGAYTVQVTGSTGSPQTGDALVEIYEVP